MWTGIKEIQKETQIINHRDTERQSSRMCLEIYITEQKNNMKSGSWIL